MKKIQFDVRNFACRSAVSVSIAAGLALSLSACGDDVTEINNNSAIAVLKSGEKLSKQSCDSTNVGEMLFVMDSVTTFVCDGNEWQTMKGETGSDGKSCKAKSVKNKAKTLEGIEVTCDGAVMDTIWNGVDGAKGDSGAVGVACTATKLNASKDHKNGGFKITCGEDSYELWNGDDGESAYELSGSELSQEKWIESLNGAKGDGCTLDDDGKGSLTVACGDAEPVVLFKAMCGGEPYEPAKKFCLDGEFYSCGDKSYNPKTQYCLELGDEESKTFKIEALLVDRRDNQVYRTVTIGEGENSQVWMAENLNFNSNFLPEGKTAAADSVINSWCYGDDENHCNQYGRLYTWAAAVGKTEDECGYEHECSLTLPVQGVCPSGWHLPSLQEFEPLINVADPSFRIDSEDWNSESKSAGTELKSKEGWAYQLGVPTGTDSYGFSALPAGQRNFMKDFCNELQHAYFWSASEAVLSELAFYLQFSYYDNLAILQNGNKSEALSVRCLKD